MQGYTELELIAAKRKTPFIRVASKYINHVKSAPKVQRVLFGGTVLVATFLFAISDVHNNAIASGNNSAEVSAIQQTQPIGHQLTEQSAISTQTEIISENTAIHEAADGPVASNQVSVTAHSENSQNNNTQTVSRSINNSGAAQIDVTVNSSEQSSTSSHTRIRSNTSASGNTSISIKSRSEASN
jgi:hypothetical protein